MPLTEKNKNSGSSREKELSFGYDLPGERIALYPAAPRHTSRLMSVSLRPFKIEHRQFSDIGEYLDSGDVIAVNNSRVINARLKGKKDTGGKTEFLLIRKKGNLWEAFGRPASRLREGMDITVYSSDGKKSSVRIESKNKGGVFFLSAPENILDFGYIPLPPYILSRRKLRESDYRDYQTNFARLDGSVASSTSALHFSSELIKDLKNKGIDFVPVTLHVGPGTFKADYSAPDPERYEVTGSAASRLNSDGNICACGTTVMRTLETVYLSGRFGEGAGEADIFVTPGHKFSPVSSFITNFHLPGTPLLLMVAAYIDQYYPGKGKEITLKLYREALDNNYRFLSYGDAMLLRSGTDDSKI